MATQDTSRQLKTTQDNSRKLKGYLRKRKTTCKSFKKKPKIPQDKLRGIQVNSRQLKKI